MNSQIRRLEIAPPGGRPVGVDCVLGDIVDDSKRWVWHHFWHMDGAHTRVVHQVVELCLFRLILRYGTIEKQDKDLTSNQTVLDIGTKARNREFHENLQAIHEKVAVVQHRVSPCINY
jgi:hypothetical protein